MKRYLFIALIGLILLLIKALKTQCFFVCKINEHKYYSPTTTILEEEDKMKSLIRSRMSSPDAYHDEIC